jgi:sulfide:quinone oxidoreductase
MANIIVVGGGIGGLSAAFDLRHLLPKQHKVTLVSDKKDFFFVPGWGQSFLAIKR